MHNWYATIVSRNNLRSEAFSKNQIDINPLQYLMVWNRANNIFIEKIFRFTSQRYSTVLFDFDYFDTILMGE